MARRAVGRTASTGRIPRPSTRVQRAEGEGEISEVENLILGQIRNYFDLPFSRHFEKFDENELANRILWMISGMELPTELNIYYFLDPCFMDPDRPGPLPREDIDNFLVSVGNYILSLKQDDFDFQVVKRHADTERMKIQYARSVNLRDQESKPLTILDGKPVTVVKKMVKKIKRRVQS